MDSLISSRTISRSDIDGGTIMEERVDSEGVEEGLEVEEDVDVEEERGTIAASILLVELPKVFTVLTILIQIGK